jgi:hypothetical protein
MLLNTFVYSDFEEKSLNKTFSENLNEISNDLMMPCKIYFFVLIKNPRWIPHCEGIFVLPNTCICCYINSIIFFPLNNNYSILFILSEMKYCNFVSVGINIRLYFYQSEQMLELTFHLITT